MIQVTLVRHGLSEANKQQRLSGWIDVDLSEEGVEKLEDIKANNIYFKSDMYVVSDLKRCIQTFDILFGDYATLDKIDQAFREVYFGECEGKSYKEVDPKVYFDNWLEDEVPDIGETYTQFKARIMRALDGLYEEAKAKEKKTVTLVCHCGVIRVILLELLGLEPKQNWHWKIPNGKGYTLHIKKQNEQLELIEHQAVV